MRILFILGCVVFMSFSTAHAAASKWTVTNQAYVRLLSDINQTFEHDSFEGGVEVDLTKDWHTYWRVPGDAGLAPVFDWSGSTNVKNVTMVWPAPVRKEEKEFQTFAYDEPFIIPIYVELENPGQEVRLKLKMEMMFCKDICIPQKVENILEIPPRSELKSSEAGVLKAARSKVPVAGDTPGLKIDTVVAGPDGLAISVYSKSGFDGVDVFADADGFAFTAVPEVTDVSTRKGTAIIKVSKPSDVEDLQAFLEGKSLNVVVTAGEQAVEKAVSF